jgi:transcriptional regulator with XRE-family HTH domain
VAKNNLKRILDEEGKSQADLCRISNVSTGTLNKVFNEKRTPAPKTLSKIVAGLNKISEKRYARIDVFPNIQAVRESVSENNLKEILDKEGKTQTELEKVSNVNVGTINKVFNERNKPAKKTLSKIVDGINQISETKYNFSEVFPNYGDEDDDDDYC